MALLPPGEGRVSSCSCFLCGGCERLLLESPTKRCPSCLKERVKSISLSIGEMPDEVSNSLCNITDKLESFHETLMFQVKHYKRALNFAFNAMNDLKNDIARRDEELSSKSQELNNLRSLMGRNNGIMMTSDESSSNRHVPAINASNNNNNNNFFEDSNQEENSSSSFTPVSQQSSVQGRPMLMNPESTSPSGSSDQGGYKASSVSSLSLSPHDHTIMVQSQKSSVAYHLSDRNNHLEIPNPALSIPTTLSGYEISPASTGPVTSRLEDVGIRKRNRSPGSDADLRQRPQSNQPKQTIDGVSAIRGVGGSGRAGIGILKPPGSGSYGERGRSPVLKSDLHANERSKGRPRTPSSSYANRMPSPNMRNASHQKRPNTSLGVYRVGPLGTSSIRSPHPPHLPLKGSKSATMTKEDLIQLQRDEITQRDKASNTQTFQRFQDID